MTFDDGIVKIYQLTDVAEAGKKPKPMLGGHTEHCFSFETLGINRYYTALQANQQIESVISVPDWQWINPEKQVAVMEDTSQFRIRMVQRTTDENGLQVTRLSLERIGDAYAVLP